MAITKVMSRDNVLSDEHYPSDKIRRGGRKFPRLVPHGFTGFEGSNRQAFAIIFVNHPKRPAFDRVPGATNQPAHLGDARVFG
ncbi:MAG: hypothetical protein EBS68_10810 [Rhodobacteraceae bacterium]|nr:hypothetical protein [Paracoccaceae bacterium]